jgi:hypothetical protein
MKVTVTEAKESMRVLQHLSDKTMAWLEGLAGPDIDVEPTLEPVRGWYDRTQNCLLAPDSAASRFYGQFAAQAVVLLRILGSVPRA